MPDKSKTLLHDLFKSGYEIPSLSNLMVFDLLDYLMVFGFLFSVSDLIRSLSASYESNS
jgi:hypothetical protein